MLQSYLKDEVHYGTAGVDTVKDKIKLRDTLTWSYKHNLRKDRLGVAYDN